MEKLFYTAEDIKNILGFNSKSKSYDLIRKLNIEIQNKNKDTIVFPGRINKEYFEKRIKVEE